MLGVQYGLDRKIWGLGLGLRVEGLGLRAEGLALRVYG